MPRREHKLPVPVADVSHERHMLEPHLKLKYPVQRDHWKEETMRRLDAGSAVIGVVALGIAGAASAGEYKNADALSVAQGKPKRTDCSSRKTSIPRPIASAMRPPSPSS